MARNTHLLSYSGFLIGILICAALFSFAATTSTTPESGLSIPAPAESGPPGNIDDLRVLSTTSTSITFNWSAVGDDGYVGVASSYDMRRSSSTFSLPQWTSLTQVTGLPAPGQPGTTETFTVTGLTAGNTYYFAVRARDDAGNLSASYNIVRVIPTATPDSQAPTVPGSLQAIVISATQINLSWAASTDNISVTGYQVERCTGTTCTPTSTVGTPTGTTFSNTGLTAGTTYRYQVRAYDAVANLSGPSNIVNATTPSPDTTAPTVSITAPASGATLSGSSVTLSAAATDNVGVLGVQFRVDGTNVGSEDTTSPYSIVWNSATVANGSHTITAVARDAAGNSTTSTGITVTVSNTGVQVVTLGPSGDTTLNLDAINHSTELTLNTYTWPAQRIANAILMKFNLSSIPAGSTISNAVLNLTLTETDATTDPTYTVPVHKIINRNPNLATATGYTYDGTNAWTANTCCDQNIPLAQADTGPQITSLAVDKTLGVKSWNITSLIQDWFTTPAANFGLLLNSDPTKGVDQYRFFASMEDATASRRPTLTVTYTAGSGGDTTPPGVPQNVTVQ